MLHLPVRPAIIAEGLVTGRAICFCLISLAPLYAQFTPACPASAARPEMTEGLNALRQKQYVKAAEHFQSATQLDPSCANAWMSLGTACMLLYIPGSPAPENLEWATRAHAAFENALAQQPENELAMASIASLYFNQKKLEEAKDWYGRLTVLNPENKEAFYTLGVIAWTRSYQARLAARAKLGMKPEDPGPLPDSQISRALREKYLPVLQEGVEDLETALQLDGDYDDAMAYLNLLYREKAEMENSPGDYRADLAKADEWARQCLATRKSKAGRPQ
jgi:Tfp pilus assembly protein PilF